MKNPTYTIVFLIIVLIFIQSIDSQEKIKSTPKGKEYTYFDGNQQIKVYLQEDLLAELHLNRSYIKSYDSNAVPIKKSGNVKIYRVQDNKIKNQVMQGRFTKNIASDIPVSEVFLSENGALMALPGNLILLFKEEVKEQEILNFLEKRGLTLIQKQMLAGKTFYVVKYKPGIECLELANQLKNEPIVEFSQPDWWKEYSLR